MNYQLFFVFLHRSIIALYTGCRSQTSSYVASVEAAYAVRSMAESSVTKRYNEGIGWEK